MKFKALHDTWFKSDPVQAQSLAEDDRVLVKAGATYAVHSHAPAEAGHVKVALKDAALGPQGRNTWYVFAAHVSIEGNEPDNNPNDTEDPPAPAQLANYWLPGYDPVNLNEPIIAGGNFTWAEATKNGTRRPSDRAIVATIIRTAEWLEEMRERLGNRPVRITSWYRPPLVNRQVGGASRSRHVLGDAVDFQVEGLRPAQVYAQLNDWWGGRGGLASSNTFTHGDGRGYRARWRY